jgi:hypothetical protein
MIISLDVYVSDCCTYCVNLKIILEKLISKGIIKYPVTFVDIDDGQTPVPTIVKNLDRGNPQQLRGLPVRNLLYKFLEIPANEDEIDGETTKKTGKIFRIPEYFTTDDSTLMVYKNTK